MVKQFEVILLQVLLWLKQWDSTVFGSEVRSTSDEVLSALKRHSSSSQNKKFSDSNHLRRDRGSKWNKENYRHSNDSGHKPDNVDSNLNGVQELLNKKSRPIGPPEQKVCIFMLHNSYPTSLWHLEPNLLNL